jgi:hypothetical protein
MIDGTQPGADNCMDFEHWPQGEALDETDVSLRAYVSRLPEDHLAKYDPKWTDEQVMEWDGNFRIDGSLMLVCCERDVDVHEFRRVLEGFLRYRANAEGARPHAGAD